MQLRRWQTESVESALNFYRAGNHHYFCLATPGAGKTTMAAEVAAQLIELDLIDYVLCFSPSINVSEGIEHTFTRRLNRRFDGVIGAAGGSYTYQSLVSFKEEFWQILKNSRVLVIFDEIHHCAGGAKDTINIWGQEIIANIQSKARYTLAMSGTPWRSDQAPIALSSYCKEDNKISVNYMYGLREAVNDNVCRKPKIVLIDNERVHVSLSDNQRQEFRSFGELLDSNLVSYQSLLSNNGVVKYILQRGCEKLREIRDFNKNAGGLVVTSNIEHAQQVAHILKKEFRQTVTLVSYQHDSPSKEIKKFRENNTQWIVSIGMVAEGTDIPRLQVCCHLSRVRTELYFRQVLGRILRVNQEIDQSAWFFTLSESNLTKYAKRIDNELPDYPVVCTEYLSQSVIEDDSPEVLEQVSLEPEAELISGASELEENDEIDHVLGSSEQDFTNCVELDVLGDYSEQVVETFNSPF